MKSDNLLNGILLVDDDPIALLLSHTVLSDMFSANRIEATNDVEKACEFLNNCIPDLLVVDMIMPQMDGFEFIYRICHSFKIDNSKIVVSSAYLNPYQIEKLNNMGIKYIIKPITEEKLLKILESNPVIKLA